MHLVRCRKIRAVVTGGTLGFTSVIDNFASFGGTGRLRQVRSLVLQIVYPSQVRCGVVVEQ